MYLVSVVWGASFYSRMSDTQSPPNGSGTFEDGLLRTSLHVVGHTDLQCRATTQPPRPSSTAECLHLIAHLREEQASAASWEPRPPFEAAEMD